MDFGSLNRRGLLSGMGTAASAVSLSEFAHASDDSNGRELLVGYAASEEPEAVARRLPGRATVIDRNTDLHYLRVKIREEPGLQTMAEPQATVEQIKGAKYAEPNRTWHAYQVPQDPRYDDQYAPSQVNAEQAWAKTEAEAGVTIAIVDQGVKYDHPDLADRFGEIKGTDIVDGDDDPHPEHMGEEFHGTHVAGIAAATTDNDEGIAGVSNANLLSVRVLDQTGRGSLADIADGIQWATDQGADIINLSLGGPSQSETVKNAISYAVNNGSLPICAAGNKGTEGVGYPAKYNETVCVSAIDQNEEIADFTQYGESVDVTAPGVEVLSCWTEEDNQYNRISGTSMATPAAAGVAALGKATHPEYGPTQLRELLAATAVDLDHPVKKQGSGRVDAVNIVYADNDGGEVDPVASFTVSDSPVLVENEVTLDASRAGDPDGEIVSYEWDFGDGTTATGETVTHVWEDPELHEVSLTVTDDSDRTDTGTRTIDVLASRRPTAASHVSVTPVEVGETVFADGSYSVDPDGSIDTYQWDFGDGTTTTGKTITHTYDEPGEYELTLTVIDDSGERSTTGESVTVEPEDAICGALRKRQTETGRLERVTESDFYEYEFRTEDPCKLTASLVTELGTDFDLYLTFDGRRPTTTDYDRKATTGGNEETLVVDEEHLSTDTPLGVLVMYYSGSGQYVLDIEERGTGDADGPSEPNEPPEAVINANQTTISPGDWVSYNAMDASDPDGAIDSYEWTFGDGTTDYGAFVSRQYTEPGEYEVTLTVTDDRGATDTAKQTITVTNAAPNPVITPPPSSGTVGEALTFDASESDDPDGTIERYDWGFDDGSTAEGETVAHAFETAGIHWITLSVTDEYGATERTSTSIRIREPQGCSAHREHEQFEGTLDQPFDSQQTSYTATTPDPCQLSVSLDGPDDADFDLYLTTDGRTPTSWDYDERSRTPDSQEQIVLDDVDPDTELGVLVYSWDGTGSFTLSIEETGRPAD
jgi:serine protease